MNFITARVSIYRNRSSESGGTLDIVLAVHVLATHKAPDHITAISKHTSGSALNAQFRCRSPAYAAITLSSRCRYRGAVGYVHSGQLTVVSVDFSVVFDGSVIKYAGCNLITLIKTTN